MNHGVTTADVIRVGRAKVEVSDRWSAVARGGERWRRVRSGGVRCGDGAEANARNSTTAAEVVEVKVP